MTRNKGQGGFSLIELLIVTVIIAVVVIMSSDTFSIILRQSGQQTKVVSSEIDGIVGLGMLRYDIEHAGYGLPDQFQNTINYSEASPVTASGYNDAATGVPRAVITGNNTGYNNSDYLVIKSTIAGTSEAAQRWTYITKGSNPKTWDSAKLNLAAGNRVVVIKPRSDEGSQNELIMNGSTFFTQYSSSSFPTAFSPQRTAERFIIYGVNPDTNLRMPFNRADYYVARPANNMPPSCAPNTGILYKATVDHSDGSLSEMPLIDCVADMQVIFRTDTNGDGLADSQSNNISALTAQQIRQRIREVRIYLLVQEGQKDTSYKHSPSTVTVGEFGLGSTFNLSTTIGTGWQNYRWKTYAFTVKPKQLQQ